MPPRTNHSRVSRKLMGMPPLGGRSRPPRTRSQDEVEEGGPRPWPASTTAARGTRRIGVTETARDGPQAWTAGAAERGRGAEEQPGGDVGEGRERELERESEQDDRLERQREAPLGGLLEQERERRREREGERVRPPGRSGPRGERRRDEPEREERADRRLRRAAGSRAPPPRRRPRARTRRRARRARLRPPPGARRPRPRASAARSYRATGRGRVSA